MTCGASGGLDGDRREGICPSICGVFELSQITLYLDDATEALVNRAADASGMSKSRWVAELIRQHAHDVWPADFLSLDSNTISYYFRGDARVVRRSHV